MRLDLIREFIREQIASGDLLGARQSFMSKDTDPFTYEDYAGYDIDIVADVHGGFALTVKFDGEKISPMNVFKDYAEAEHKARMIIDKHRVEKVSPHVKKKNI